jgi:hypothetical protein
MPFPQLFTIRRLIARILRLNGAGEYIEQILGGLDQLTVEAWFNQSGGSNETPVRWLGKLINWYSNLNQVFCSLLFLQLAEK